ncbi:MAG: hypothetical protein JNK05_29950 [Myxococcales bacterium]|nr:hypothetical protein [Myxococcales bacterium]
MFVEHPHAGARRTANSSLSSTRRPIESTADGRHLCVAADAWIATPRGPVPIAEVREGADVYVLEPTAGLRVARVASRRSAGVQQVLRIETAGRCVRVTATQLVSTVVSKGKRDGAIRRRAAGELDKSDLILCAEGYFAQDSAQSAELARVIGAFLGMGYIERGRVGATVGAWDESHAEQYRALFERVFAGAGWEHGAGMVGGISCADPAVAAQLEQLGFVRAMEARVVPPWAFSLPREAKLALIAGYMDSAGRMARDSKKALTGAGKINAQFCPRLVRELRELAIGAALDVSAIQYERPNDPTLSVRSVALLSPASMAELPCWDPHKHVTTTVAPLRVGPDKLGGLTLPPSAFAQKIKLVEPEPPVEVFALEVEDAAGSFIADGVVLHH